MKRFLQITILFLAMLALATISRAESACFVVTAYNDYGESDYSIEVCADIPAGKSAILSWNKVPGATGYKIYYRPAWETEHNKARSIDVGDVDMTRILAEDIFKLSSPTNLIIQAE